MSNQKETSFENLMNVLNSKKTREEKLSLELNSRENMIEEQRNSGYTETPIRTQEEANKNLQGLGSYGLGDFLKFSEINETTQDVKIVYFKDYYTQINKFNPTTKDVVFTFVDREGFQFDAYAFGRLDTSNIVTETENLNKLKGNAVILGFSSIKKGNKVYINPIKVKKCEELHGNVEEVSLFFQGEIEDKVKYIEDINQSIVIYPLAEKVWEDNYSVLINAPIKGILNRKGEFVRYFSKLLQMLNHSELDKAEVETILIMEIVVTLKENLTQISSLSLNLGDTDVLSVVEKEALYRVYENKESQICWEMVQLYRDLIYTELQILEHKKYNTNRFYNVRTNKYLLVEREDE